jgi:uncharacterized transporter YbjL
MDFRVHITMMDAFRFLWDAFCTLGLVAFWAFIGIAIGIGLARSAHKEECIQRIIGRFITALAVIGYLLCTHWIHM